MADQPTSVPPPAAFVNAFRVAHNVSEFYFELGQLVIGNPELIHIVATVVTTPINAKKMLHALQENVARYERQNGEIILPAPPSAPRSDA